jgi:hypothetical protein
VAALLVLCMFCALFGLIFLALLGGLLAFSAPA